MHMNMKFKLFNGYSFVLYFVYLFDSLINITPKKNTLYITHKYKYSQNTSYYRTFKNNNNNVKFE